MSSCKKWNSCNDKCKRNSGRRGGGNGVIGKDGATGPTGHKEYPELLQIPGLQDLLEIKVQLDYKVQQVHHQPPV